MKNLLLLINYPITKLNNVVVKIAIVLFTITAFNSCESSSISEIESIEENKTISKFEAKNLEAKSSSTCGAVVNATDVCSYEGIQLYASEMSVISVTSGLFNTAPFYLYSAELTFQGNVIASTVSGNLSNQSPSAQITRLVYSSPQISTSGTNDYVLNLTYANSQNNLFTCTTSNFSIGRNSTYAVPAFLVHRISNTSVQNGNSLPSNEFYANDYITFDMTPSSDIFEYRLWAYELDTQGNIVSSQSVGPLNPSVYPYLNLRNTFNNLLSQATHQYIKIEMTGSGCEQNPTTNSFHVRTSKTIRLFNTVRPAKPDLTPFG